jgi:hypothetical protein
VPGGRGGQRIRKADRAEDARVGEVEGSIYAEMITSVLVSAAAVWSFAPTIRSSPERCELGEG